MPASLESGMGDCVQTEGMNNFGILKGNIFPMSGEQVYKVSETFLPQNSFNNLFINNSRGR